MDILIQKTVAIRVTMEYAVEVKFSREQTIILQWTMVLQKIFSQSLNYVKKKNFRKYKKAFEKFISLLQKSFKEFYQINFNSSCFWSKIELLKLIGKLANFWFHLRNFYWKNLMNELSDVNKFCDKSIFSACPSRVVRDPSYESLHAELFKYFHQIMLTFEKSISNSNSSSDFLFSNLEKLEIKSRSTSITTANVLWQSFVFNHVCFLIQN